jgi:hypothetical protein
MKFGEAATFFVEIMKVCLGFICFNAINDVDDDNVVDVDVDVIIRATKYESCSITPHSSLDKVNNNNNSQQQQQQ